MEEPSANLGISMPSSSFGGLSNPKNAFDAISRRSTAMSNDGLTEHGTPGQSSATGAAAKMASRGGSGKARRQNSNRVSNGEMGGTNQLLQEASNEAITLSLDPQKGKKKKNAPRTLKPIDYQKQAPKGGKIVGNYAAQVLADLEAKDKNRKMATEMKQLDRDIKGYLKFDVKGMAEQMNDAFDGTKDKDKPEGAASKPTDNHGSSYAKKEKKTLAITAGGSTAQLGKHQLQFSTRLLFIVFFSFIRPYIGGASASGVRSSTLQAQSNVGRSAESQERGAEA